MVRRIPPAILHEVKRAPTRGRKQIHLPEFTISLVRTPFLSPRYAQFRVPLNLNKLDLTDYLRHGYGVDVISVRSYVELQPVTRITRDGKGYGAWRRPKSQKRMTVELKEPFVWPEEPKDLSKWEKENWDSSEKYQHEMSRPKRRATDFAEEPDDKLRKAYEEQAKELLQDKQAWRPTWQALGLEYPRAQTIRPIPRWKHTPPLPEERGE